MAGAKNARSRSSRVSSTPPWLAASSSTTSTLPGPFGASEMHESHLPHGSGVGPSAQFSDRARIRALDVLPQPRGPENRYAWLTRLAASAVRSGSVTCSCPTTWANVAGRYLRYRARATPRLYLATPTKIPRPPGAGDGPSRPGKRTQPDRYP